MIAAGRGGSGISSGSFHGSEFSGFVIAEGRGGSGIDSGSSHGTEFLGFVIVEGRSGSGIDSGSSHGSEFSSGKFVRMYGSEIHHGYYTERTSGVSSVIW